MPQGKVGISLGKMVPNLSRTVCIEKLTESVSITGFSLSGMVGVKLAYFRGGGVLLKILWQNG